MKLMSKVTMYNRQSTGFLFFTVLLSLLLWRYDLEAGTITLVVDSTTRVTGTLVHTRLQIKNNGTDTAKDIVLTAECLDQKTDVPVTDMIAPYGSSSAGIDFTLPQGARGTFPIFITLTYADPAGQPHSAAVLAVARTVNAQPSNLTLSVTQEKQSGEHRILVSVQDPSARIQQTTFTFHGPDDIGVSWLKQQVRFDNGRATGAFNLLHKKEMDTLNDPRNVFVTAEYELGGVHYFIYASTVLTPEASKPDDLKADAIRYPIWATVAFILLIVLLIGFFIYKIQQWRKPPAHRSGSAEARFEGVIDILVLVVIEGFILYHLTPDQLIRDTITTGGDTASHYYTLDVLRHQLLPQGKITGWTPGNYAGFPILQFYFPLPFLLMCVLNLFIPMTIAFKWVTLLGTFLLPISSYSMLRCLKTPFPGPAISAAFTLPFLFNPAYSAWGGNLLSTLAGEFSYSLSLALSLFFLGNLYRGCLEHRRIVQNAILVFLVGFSHGYTLLYVEAVSLFFLITSQGFLHRLNYLLKVYLLGFLFLAFWLVPLMVFTPYTTAYHNTWHIHSIKEVMSPVLIPILFSGGAASLGYLIAYGVFYRKGKRFPMSVPCFLWFSIAMACLMYTVAPRLGVVDIRYIPIAQLMTGLLGALGLGNLLNRIHRWRMEWWVLVIIVIASCVWTSHYTKRATDFARWNYEGFESKAGWTLFSRINDYLSGSFQDPRVVFEHSSSHNFFGSTRAFESLPLFAGRATLEGLYMQASISAPFVFYIQSEISKEKSAPFKQYSYSDMDFKRAKRHLQMFNVRDLILRSPEAKAAIRSYSDYKLVKSFGLYEIWSLKDEPHPYIIPLMSEPVLYRTDNWKSDFFQWFIDDDTEGIYLVSTDGLTPLDLTRFRLKAESLKDLKNIPIDTRSATVKETLYPDEILIDTNWIDKPLLIKMSYHPNWHVEGANKIYRVSPSFMLIYPEKEKVRLYYGRGMVDGMGTGLTGLGLMILAFQHPAIRRLWPIRQPSVQNRLQLITGMIGVLRWNPPLRTRRLLLCLGLMIGIFALGWLGYDTYQKDPDRLFNRSVKLKDLQQYDKAREGFAMVMAEAGPVSNLRSEAAYYIAICYYLEKDYSAALDAFNTLVEWFPTGLRCQEGQYHIGLCYFWLNKEQQGIDQMRLVVDNYPGTLWTEYAKGRLREHHAEDGKDITDFRIHPTEKMGYGIDLFNRNNFSEARTIFEEISEQYPSHKDAPQALACLALIYYKQTDYPKTIQYYKRLIQRYPQDPLVAEGFYHIGRSQEILGHPDKAKAAYQTLLDKYPHNIYGRYAAEKLVSRK